MRRLAALAAAALALVLAGCGNDEPAPKVDALTYDADAPLRTAAQPAVRAGVLSVERVSFVAFDGERIPGLFARPAGKRVRGAPCLLAIAGLRGRKENFDQVAAGAARLGMPVLAIDARAHGERGTPEQIDAIVRSAPRLARLLRETVLDLRRSLDYLETRDECDPERLAFLGGSLGGLAGAVLAGRDERVRATVLLVAGAGWREIFRAQDLFLPGVEDDEEALEEALAEFAPYEPAEWVARIAPRPVMVVNGTEDQYVPKEDAHRLQAAAREPKEVLWYVGRHDWTSSGDVLPAVGRFLQRNLVEAGS